MILVIGGNADLANRAYILVYFLLSGLKFGLTSGMTEMSRKGPMISRIQSIVQKPKGPKTCCLGSRDCLSWHLIGSSTMRKRIIAMALVQVLEYGG
ncbi:hypothetical protein BDV30DRAFT_207724 [Aspergillus minisclerotigenes]|uniref:Uncharacterized protein n=1 Tax=Aspergillus minisclerotigenes TaxID=656917 RepID=A0A5N6JBJ6_9EURO|nr:hypothetical protein BDV30DRAFT_207724 [Aspergillus minisclerotigenes]